MRPSDPRAAPPRRGKFVRALAMAAALLTTPWLAPEAAAARAGKAQAEHSHQRRAATPAAREKRAATPAVRPARQAARRAPARPRQVVAAAHPAAPAEPEVPGV